MSLLRLCTCKHFRYCSVLRVFSWTALWLRLEFDHIRLLVNCEHLRPVAHQHFKHHLKLSLVVGKLSCVELLEVLLFALLEESIQLVSKQTLTISNKIIPVSGVDAFECNFAARKHLERPHEVVQNVEDREAVSVSGFHFATWSSD